MSSSVFKILNSRPECQKLAQKNNRLDCLDDCSWECFKEAYVIAKISAWNPVLITGPNGTGKTGYAKLIWSENESSTIDRKDRETLSVNCAAFSENLIASELFGHVKGAFTDAKKNYDGKIRTAYKEGKCLFLDEIGDLPMTAQTMLLRFFEMGEIQPVGSAHPIKLVETCEGRENANVSEKGKDEKLKMKVVCATNKNLEEEIRKGNFREDLYNRIRKYCVTIPPLKERFKDCERNYVNYYLRFARENKVSEKKDPLWRLKVKIDRRKFGEENEKYKYQWPGNFRELQNRLHQAIVQKLINGGGVIEFEDLFPEGIEVAKAKAATEETGTGSVLSNFGFPDPDGVLPQFDLPQKLSELENAYIRKALAQVKTRADAAKLLGYKSYQTMDRRQKV